MKRLLALELKKIFTRKAVWLFIAFIIAFQLLGQSSAIKDALNGTVRGAQEVYRRYEGQVLTEAFQRKAAEDYAQIALSHPDQFNTVYDEGQNIISYSSSTGSGYYAGVALAYTDLIYGTSVESLQRIYSHAANGAMQEPPDAPVAHDLGGWHLLGRTMGNGFLLLLLMVLGLLPLYTQESSAKMDGVLLSTANRGRSAAAKTLAAVTFTLLGALLVCGGEVLIVGLTMGLDGADMPVSALYKWSVASDQTIGAFYALAAGIVVAATTAWSALNVLTSSLFRNPLVALLLITLCVAAQFVPGLMVSGSSPLYAYLQLLPVPVLASPWMWLDGMAQTKHAVFALALPAIVTVLALGLAPRCFLKRRKA